MTSYPHLRFSSFNQVLRQGIDNIGGAPILRILELEFEIR
jgi:hypothetical protein